MDSYTTWLWALIIGAGLADLGILWMWSRHYLPRSFTLLSCLAILGTLAFMLPVFLLLATYIDQIMNIFRHMPQK
jgi:hypothetical protein